MRDFIEKLSEEEKSIDLPPTRQGRDEYHRNINDLTLKFKTELFKELGIEGNPKRERLFAIAWEQGHSSGYGEVYNYALDLVDLILPESATK